MVKFFIINMSDIVNSHNLHFLPCAKSKFKIIYKQTIVFNLLSACALISTHSAMFDKWKLETARYSLFLQLTNHKRS